MLVSMQHHPKNATGTFALTKVPRQAVFAIFYVQTGRNRMVPTPAWRKNA